MPATNKLRLSAHIIVLDLVGTLLILAGALDLAGIPLGPLNQLIGGHGWTLVIAGGFSMMVAAGSLVRQILARQHAGGSGPTTSADIQTVERRAP
jgi:hypothetical protein